MDFVVRQETENDYAEVFAVVSAAFEQDDEARLVNLLRRRMDFIRELSLVAVLNDQIIGHILFSIIKIVPEEGTVSESLALAPLAVLPEFQGLGAGSLLIQAGLEIARGMGYSSAVVLGHQHYYPRFGFFPAEKWKILAPFPVPPGVFMATELVPEGLKNVSGTVSYPPEFDSL